jgi:3-methylcrotonyl-CoA carboxylase alpha subunit
MAQALGEFQIAGVINNVQFLSRLVATPAFVTADLDTTLIEREHARLFPAPQAAPDAAIAAAALAVVTLQHSLTERGPGAAVWRSGRGWRLNAPARQRVSLRSQGSEKVVWARYVAGGYELELGDTTVFGAGPRAPHTALQLTIDGQIVRAEVIIQRRRCDVFINGGHHVIERDDPLAHVAELEVADGGIRAPMPGKVVALLVHPGARVVKGEPLLSRWPKAQSWFSSAIPVTPRLSAEHDAAHRYRCLLRRRRGSVLSHDLHRRRAATGGESVS